MNKLFYSLLFYCLSVSLSNERETDNSLLFEQTNESSMLIIENRLPIADPYVLFYEDKYYAYGTRTNGFEVYISDDLEHWRRGDRLALSPQDSWGTKWYWAPEVYYIESEKKFYMFYTVDEHICVATSDSPEGPFVQDEKKPVREEKGIDASLFVDDDGKAYLYFVRFTGGNVIWGVEMNSDLKSVKEETLRECIKADASWELQQAKVAEGPSLLKRNGVYYLIYSANHFRSQDYAVGYATATSPLGPWKKYDGNPILCRDKDVAARLVGTGHGAPFLCRDGSYKYIYHAHSSVNRVEPRTSYLNDLIFGDDGVISIVGNVIKPVVESSE
ncbi:MAG TPA: glycoside hydrolase family 43 protein [Candidatus Bacteroides intestinigallinarum]|nr:glycoside hydrolase family 43 protein [Candidatus Bacteroides intestinigallinarum]